MGTLLRSGDQLRAVGAARRGAGRDAAHVAHGPVVARRSVPAAGRHRPARRGGAVAAARRGQCASPAPDAPHNARAYELYLRANELARTYDGLARGARSVPALPGAGSALRAGVGAPRSLPSRDRQVHRRHARQRGARRGGLPPRARAQPAPLGGAQVLREPRGGHRPGAASARAPAGRGQPSRQRSGAVRRARPRLPLLRTLRAVHRRARRGAPARSERPDEPRADAADDGRHRSAPGRRAAAGRRGRRRRDPGHRARAGGAARRGARGRCSTCARRRAFRRFRRGPTT